MKEKIMNKRTKLEEWKRLEVFIYIGKQTGIKKNREVMPN